MLENSPEHKIVEIFLGINQIHCSMNILKFPFPGFHTPPPTGSVTPVMPALPTSFSLLLIIRGTISM